MFIPQSFNLTFSNKGKVKLPIEIICLGDLYTVKYIFNCTSPISSIYCGLYKDIQLVKYGISILKNRDFNILTIAIKVIFFHVH